MEEWWRQQYLFLLAYTKSLAAPSVAGTQPAWIRQESCSECDGDGCAKCQTLKDRIAELLKLGSGDEDGPSEDAVFDYVKALHGAAQGTPQVEEIAREIVASAQVIKGPLVLPDDVYDELAICPSAEAIADILRSRLVGAPAQPGPSKLESALRGVKELFANTSPFYIKKLGGPITNADQARIDRVFMALDEAFESTPSPAQGTPEPPKAELQKVISGRDSLKAEIRDICEALGLPVQANEIDVRNVARAKAKEHRENAEKYFDLYSALAGQNGQGWVAIEEWPKADAFVQVRDRRFIVPITANCINGMFFSIPGAENLRLVTPAPPTGDAPTEKK